jgi:uncharacterized protein
MRFTLHCSDGRNKRTFHYDNETSHLTDDAGKRIVEPGAGVYANQAPTPKTSVDTPNGKQAAVRVLKIQLGLSCNYACEYCSQRFVPHAADAHPTMVDRFVCNLDRWLVGVPERIEFWGGEPLVYIKTLKPLAEALRKKFPDTLFLMITNGSLLNAEINQWLEDLDFSVGVSHDGPGQHVRGPDPLADPEQRKHILDLFKRLRPKGKISFNAMINRKNLDRAAIQEFFRGLLGPAFNIGEGSFIDPYDEGGEANSLQNHEEALAFRNLTLKQIRSGKINRFHVTQKRIGEWMRSISSGRPAESLGQKCGMDRPDTIAVDLLGNVLTCQNVSTVSKAPNGQSHRIGHVSHLDKVKLKTATHWSKRPDCASCPVVQACKGSCMFLEGPLWEKACNNAFNDHVPFFAAAIERLTGYLPYEIEAPGLPPERSTLWTSSGGG